MTKVLFLVHRPEDFGLGPLLQKHLDGVGVEVSESMPVRRDDFALIVLWNYKKILRGLGENRNIMVFHSTDLPAGKGWAPIYYALAGRNEDFTVTGILASDEVDSGDIVCKARFKIKDNHTAPFLRKCDEEIIVILIKEIVRRFEGRPICGVKQGPTLGPFNARRRPDANEVDVDRPFKELIPHLRACEPQHPAFFHLNGTRYNIVIEPVEKPEFPSDLAIEFYEGLASPMS